VSNNNDTWGKIGLKAVCYEKRNLRIGSLEIKSKCGNLT